MTNKAVPQTRTEANRAAAPKVAGKSPMVASSNIMQLQRRIGNQAVMRMLGNTTVQRMPSRERVIGELGKPHRDVKLFGVVGPTLKENSTKYKTALDALDAFRQYVNNTGAGNTRSEVMDRLTNVLSRFDTIINACDAYQGEEGDKAEYFLRLKIQAQNEKTSAIGDMMQYANRITSIPQFVRTQAKISGVLRTQPGALDTNEGDFQQTVGGGINQLAMYQSGNNSSFFKQNTGQITAPEDMDESNPMTTATYTAQDAGINTQDVRSANRDVATYRLDQLLGANVIARTQFALRDVNGTSNLGSMMEGAKGQRAGDLGKQDLIGNDAAPVQNGITTQDPNLMRQLSKLQLIDALAGQIDRNTGNFFIQFDRNGNVVRVTGIDNDASFGTRNEVQNKYREYPGFSKYVDKETANAILTIPETLFRAIVSDLLTPQEVDAFIQRFTKLKSLLASNQTRLLDPQQWDQAVNQGLMQEKMSFTAVVGQAGWDGN